MIFSFPAIMKQLLVQNMYRAVLTCTVEILYEQLFVIHGESTKAWEPDLMLGGGWEDNWNPSWMSQEDSKWLVSRL